MGSLSPGHVVSPDEFVVSWVDSGDHLVGELDWLNLLGGWNWWSLESNHSFGCWVSVLVVGGHISGHVQNAVV